MDGFENWALTHPEKFKELQRQIIVGLFDIVERGEVQLVVNGSLQEVKILTAPDLDLVFGIRRDNGSGALEDIWVKVVDPEKEILEVEMIK